MSNPYESPNEFSEPPMPASPTGGDSTGGVIPYKNPHALAAYYLAIFGLFPCIGIVLSVPALILGIIGLQKRKLNPQIKGSVHAWIGIIVGGLCTLGHLLGIGLIVVGAISG